MKNMIYLFDFNIFINVQNTDTIDYQLWRYNRNGDEVIYKAIFLHDKKMERFYGYINPKSLYDKYLNFYNTFSGKY